MPSLARTYLCTSIIFLLTTASPLSHTNITSPQSWAPKVRFNNTTSPTIPSAAAVTLNSTSSAIKAAIATPAHTATKAIQNAKLFIPSIIFGTPFYLPDPESSSTTCTSSASSLRSIIPLQLLDIGKLLWWYAGLFFVLLFIHDVIEESQWARRTEIQWTSPRSKWQVVDGRMTFLGAR
ncbi:MAG: hypothetical protein Q9166_006868 [cf. Caloplaca sp. 2 TL-2023]